MVKIFNVALLRFFEGVSDAANVGVKCFKLFSRTVRGSVSASVNFSISRWDGVQLSTRSIAVQQVAALTWLLYACVS